MKKIFNILTLFFAILLCAANTAAAQTEQAYVVLSTDGTTLTFKYGVPPQTGKTYDPLNTGTSLPGWFDDAKNTVTTVVFEESFKDVTPTSCHGWFWTFEKLNTITDIQYLNTSQVTSMYAMFLKCYELTDLDLSSFNTANVTDMNNMFSNCQNLKTLDVSNFNTTSVTNMSAMFANCYELTAIDVSKFNTASVTDMSSMFSSCKSLTDLDVSHFNTAIVTDMHGMFYGCSKLTNLDLNNFNTARVTNMMSMFSDCINLENLNVSKFNTANVTNIVHINSAAFFCICIKSQLQILLLNTRVHFLMKKF